MMKTRKEALSWIMAQKGRWLDVDGWYGAQCVDLIMYYFTDFWGIANHPRGDAKEWAYLPLPSGWRRVRNTPNFVPKPGDIVVWNNGTRYGHIGLVISANVNEFTSLEQNLVGNITTGSPGEVVRHTNWAYTWFIVPPFNDNYTVAQPAKNKTDAIFNARVTCDVLNVRKGAGTQYPIVKQLYRGGVYTVTEEKNGWGRLKSCKDWWICLEYTKKEPI